MSYPKIPIVKQELINLISTVIGTFLATYSLKVFLIPNQIIDGGVVGIGILLAHAFGDAWLYAGVVIFNLPFVVLAYKSLGKRFVFQMIAAVLFFVLFGAGIEMSEFVAFQPYRGDLLEIVVIGGLILGIGVGLIIRSGGCLDGTEILGVILNRRSGFSVGSVVLAANVFIFGAAGFVYDDWHPPIKSLITFFIVIKVMDLVIMGLDEMKTVQIITAHPKTVAKVLMHELGLGLTIIHGSGGYTGQPRDVLLLIAERLQLNAIKSLVRSQDPSAFIAIANLSEVSAPNMSQITKKTHRRTI